MENKQIIAQQIDLITEQRVQIVQVALPVPLDNLYDYLIPFELQAQAHVTVGGRVLVPFGQKSTKKIIGIVIQIKEQSDFDIKKLKKVIEIIDTQPLWCAPLFMLLKWAASYYHYPLGAVLSVAMPKVLRHGKTTSQKPQVMWQLTELGLVQDLNLLIRKAPKQAQLLRLLRPSITNLSAIKSVTEGSLPKLTKPQIMATGITSSVLNELQKKGWLHSFQADVLAIKSWKDCDQPLVNSQDIPVLNSEQAVAVAVINQSSGFSCFLIDGITGSGKTEVYLNVIKPILEQGRQVLILVPEIGLTPQTIARFQQRFSVPLAVMHSGLNDQQRFDSWLAIKNNQAAILIGTRSSLFTPFVDLGMIIIDEEHDSAYKQQDTFRYHARDLAIIYGHRLKIPVLLGSATPSIETLYNAKQHKYHHLKLTQRAGNAAVAKHHLLDIRGLHLEAGISAPLLVKMRQHLQQGNQVMLFLNRRGFAPTLICHECGWVAQCARCEQPYTVHQQRQQLRCHHCDSTIQLPKQCMNPKCGSTHLITLGVGTEQLEEALAKLFPEYQTIRIDRDSTRRKGSLETYLEAIQKKEYHILIGTQMLAKGHHFPDVTLVGLLNVDSSLFSSDFRASEKLAQLYVQIAGRSGRASKQGDVILQTHHPEHPLLQLLLNSGYSEFGEQILQERQATGLPPYNVMALLRMQANTSEIVEQILTDVTQWLNHELITDKSVNGSLAEDDESEIYLFGPTIAPLAKRSGQFRWLLGIHGRNRKMLHKFIFRLKYGLRQHPLISKVKYSLDIDPCDFL